MMRSLAGVTSVTRDQSVGDAYSHNFEMTLGMAGPVTGVQTTSVHPLPGLLTFESRDADNQSIQLHR